MRLQVVHCLLLILAGAAAPAIGEGAESQRVLEPVVTLANARHLDQDDMCIWVHPERPELSVIVTSDKTAELLFVYDLEGKTLQEIPVEGQPGNIDLRYGFPLGGKTVDIVAYNDRSGNGIRVYAVDPATRLLARVDDGNITTGPNYGFALYRSPKSGTFYAFTVAEEATGGAEQYALTDDGKGRITGKQVRAWAQPKSEGCVADDETGRLYIGEEEGGIWALGAEPDDPAPGAIIVPVTAQGISPDIEGLTILYGADGAGYLIASSQGNGQYKIFDRKAPHAYVTTFTIAGANETDGIDIVNLPLGAKFPAGIFVAHNGASKPCPVVICDLSKLGLETWTRSADARRK